MNTYEGAFAVTMILLVQFCICAIIWKHWLGPLLLLCFEKAWGKK